MKTRWLGATSIHTADPTVRGFLQTIDQLCLHYPQLAVLVNFFDDPPTPKSSTTMKTLVSRPFGRGGLVRGAG